MGATQPTRVQRILLICDHNNGERFAIREKRSKSEKRKMGHQHIIITVLLKELKKKKGKKESGEMMIVPFFSTSVLYFFYRFFLFHKTTTTTRVQFLHYFFVLH